MKLSRTGGRDDQGLDLRGSWRPPTTPGLPERKITVYVQCKAMRKRTGPSYLRELEGALGLSADPHTLGILASVSPCTPGMRKHMLLSRKSLAFCSVTSYDDGGYLQQFLWNQATAGLIGRGVGVTTNNTHGYDVEGDIRKEAILTIDGLPLGFKNHNTNLKSS
jgi:hypothetical protein